MFLSNCVNKGYKIHIGHSKRPVFGPSGIPNTFSLCNLAFEITLEAID
jgi:hypothetical protein